MAFIEESKHLSIPFRDIEVATKNFTTLIGKGGYGLVYKGELLQSGKLTTVAVKRLYSNISGQGFKEFLTEIHLLSRYKHPNLVSLLGFCQEGHEKVLIYQHAARGSLDKYLSSAKGNCPLSWKQRLNICIDAACGLDYLHNHVANNHRVIHRDIKSANILLDQNWRAMISDFGLSKIGRANEKETYLITNASGTHGYCDPAYIQTGILTKESDVYSFGVVLFEVLCGRLCFINVNNEHRFLAQLAKRYYNGGKLHEIIDLGLKNERDSDSLNKFSMIAYQCLQDDRALRPSMGLVAKRLKEALELQELEEELELQELEEALGLKELVMELEFQNYESSMDLEDLNHDEVIDWKADCFILKFKLHLRSQRLASNIRYMARKKKDNLIDQAGKKKVKYEKQVKGRHNETQLHLAAQRGDLVAVKQILDDFNSQMVGGADFHVESMVNKVNELGETPLYTAAERGHLEVVKELLRYSHKETISVRSQFDFDALHIAASQGHHAVVQLLLDHDVSLCQTRSRRIRSRRNATPLITAASKGHTDVVHVLLSKDPRLLDISRSDGKLALHLAARMGHIETVKALLNKDSLLVRRTDRKGQTALHMAVKGISIEVVKLLLVADPALVMLPDKHGLTVLHVATRKKRAETVKELLSSPDVHVNALSTYHETALDIAEGLSASEESTDIRDNLSRHGALRASKLNQRQCN